MISSCKNRRTTAGSQCVGDPFHGARGLFERRAHTQKLSLTPVFVLQTAIGSFRTSRSARKPDDPRPPRRAFTVCTQDRGTTAFTSMLQSKPHVLHAGHPTHGLHVVIHALSGRHRDEKEFYDPETASSSGALHVPSKPLNNPSPRGMLSRDSGSPLDTQNTMGTSGNVFESPPLREGPSPALFEKTWNLASSSQELGPGNTGNIMEHGRG